MAQLTHDLAITAVTPDADDAVREWFDLEHAVWRADRPDDPPPCPVDHRASLSAPWPGAETTVWLARAHGAVVGRASLSLPQLDNLDNAMADLVVHPDRRRTGVGRRLLTHLADVARAAGRIRLLGETPEPLDAPGAGAGFLTAAGAHKALAARRRRLALPPDGAQLTRLGAAAREVSTGYDVVGWTGDTPEHWLDDIAALTARMSTDAPLDELNLSPERYDAQRIRQGDASCRARGMRRTVSAARGPDGRLVAFTDIMLSASVDWHAWQGDTIVEPAHRGRRLGMLVKLANLALVRDRHPALRAIDTYNADSNPYMVSINEAMGFRPLDRLGEWELEV